MLFETTIRTTRYRSCFSGHDRFPGNTDHDFSEHDPFFQVRIIFFPDMTRSDRNGRCFLTTPPVPAKSDHDFLRHHPFREERTVGSAERNVAPRLFFSVNSEHRGAGRPDDWRRHAQTSRRVRRAGAYELRRYRPCRWTCRVSIFVQTTPSRSWPRRSGFGAQ